MDGFGGWEKFSYPLYGTISLVVVFFAGVILLCKTMTHYHCRSAGTGISGENIGILEKIYVKFIHKVDYSLTGASPRLYSMSFFGRSVRVLLQTEDLILLLLNIFQYIRSLLLM